MTPQRWAVALQEHEAILNALLRRDGVGLAHILRTHLRHKREEVTRAGFAETDDNGSITTEADAQLAARQWVLT